MAILFYSLRSLNSCLFYIFVAIYLLPLRLVAQLIEWQYEDLWTEVRSSGANPDFVIDESGIFHLTYWDRNRDQLVYASKDKISSNWVTHDVDIKRLGGFRSALVIDSSGHPHIAYVYNDKELAYLAYAYQADSAWITEEVPLNSDLGLYGYDQFFPSFSHASLDIVLDAEGQPLISFYDGTLREGEVFCGPIIHVYKDYDMKLGFAFKSKDQWTVVDTLSVPHDGIGECLSTGDRFGEFNQIIPMNDDRYMTVTNSMHNHDLLLFRSDSNNLTHWDYMVLDSVDRFARGGANAKQKFRETFDFIDISKESDSLVHLVYGVSGLYGFENRTVYINATSFSRRTYFYMNFYPDSLDQEGYSPYFYELGERNKPNNPNTHDGLYRTFHTLSTKGDTAIYAFHYNTGTGEVVLNVSQDQGLTWLGDTLGSWTTNSPLQVQIWEDSLHLMFYDGLTDQIMWASSQMDSLTWNIRPVFPNTRTGNILHAGSPEINADRGKVSFVYHERISDQLYYGTYHADSFTNVSIDERGLDINAAVQTELVDATPIVIYSSWEKGTLKSAIRLDEDWTYETIKDSILATELRLEYTVDSIYIIYFDLLSQTLHQAHRSRKTAENIWLDTIIPTTGQRPGFTATHMDAGGGLHLLYVDQLNNYLIYGIRNAGSSSWRIDTVATETDFQGGFSDINTLQDGTVIMAMRDVGSNTIRFGEKRKEEWFFTVIPSEDANSIGSPLELMIDERGLPWVLYNQVSLTDELQLVQRNQEGKWIHYPLIGNTDRIAQLFDAHIRDGKIFVVGKKLRPGKEGIGLLSAPLPVVTHRDERLLTRSIKIYPNPLKETLRIMLAQKIPVENLKVFDLQGQEIQLEFAETASGKDSYLYTAKVAPLSNGLYLCRVQLKDRMLHRKFIKTE